VEIMLLEKSVTPVMKAIEHCLPIGKQNWCI